jgi:hypothetical protein
MGGKEACPGGTLQCYGPYTNCPEIEMGIGIERPELWHGQWKKSKIALKSVMKYDINESKSTVGLFCTIYINPFCADFVF